MITFGGTTGAVDWKEITKTLTSVDFFIFIDADVATITLFISSFGGSDISKTWFVNALPMIYECDADTLRTVSTFGTLMAIEKVIGKVGPTALASSALFILENNPSCV